MCSRNVSFKPAEGSFLYIHQVEKEGKCSDWNLLSTEWGKPAQEQESAQEMELYPDLNPFKSLKEEI